MTSKQKKYDYLIVGAGVIGLTVAYELLNRDSTLKIAIIEKESDVGFHSSGRNSGVLHSGFYYSADSLKAKLTADGNRLMKEFCKENSISVLDTKKVVVAKDETELNSLYELKNRGDKNGVRTEIIDEVQLKELASNIKTYKKALYSPDTASLNPKDVLYKLVEILKNRGVEFHFNTKFEESRLDYKYLINSAGLYADKIAHSFGIGKEFTLLPFKGIYMKYIGSQKPIDINLYPVPNLKNPFLGVHYTITGSGDVKIGPTAIPAFWRENYIGLSNFKIDEFFEVLSWISKLFILNSFNFRNLAVSEMGNYIKSVFVKKARDMVYELNGDFKPIPAGIRAQLLNRETKELVQDFHIEFGEDSAHILNAVSPAFTSSFAFAKYVVDKIEENREENGK
jgi:L-2-hydroxyglutarate oxidase LhgO